MPALSRFALLALGVLVCARPAHAQFGYDELARTTALTAADDYRIGKGYFDMMKWLQGSNEDPELLAGVDSMLRRLVKASDRPDQSLNFLVVPTDEINAAALPGGFLMINQGIIEQMPEEQLAFVIGHEVAHVQLRHFATTMNMNSALEVLGLAEDGRSAGDRDTAAAQTEALSKMARLYARNLELEADLYGMLYAMRAGYPARSGIESMETMRRLVGETPPGMESMSDHPSFAERIEQLGKGLETLEETYGLFEAGVAFARQSEYDAAIGAFQQFLTLFPKSTAAWNNLGAAYLRKALLNSTDPWHDEVPVYLKADVAVRAVDTMSLERAREAYGRALAIDPNRDAALAGLAVLARHEGKLDEARALLAKAIELDGKYAGYQNNLGVLDAASGKWKDADKAFAKALKLDGGATYVKVNQAVEAGQRGKTKDAIALWRELESVPQFATRAREELGALGETPSAVAARERSGEEELIAVLSEASDADVFGGSYEPAQPVERPPAPTPTKGPDGVVGKVKLGMSLAEAKAALGAPDVEEAMEDGYYAYLGWWSLGISAVFVDDVASGFEVSDPSESKTGRGLGRGSARSEIVATYGEPEYSYDDPDFGVEAVIYEARGLAFSLGPDATVQSFSVWSPGI